jgi:putative FmdB family regulatory protein
MPIYDYLCSSCDHRADLLHGINDPGPLFCPSCGAEGSMRKQFAVPAIHFKGSGWAKKDRGGSSLRHVGASAGSGDSDGAKGGDSSAKSASSETSSSSGSPGSSATSETSSSSGSSGSSASSETSSSSGSSDSSGRSSDKVD